MATENFDSNLRIFEFKWMKPRNLYEPITTHEISEHADWLEPRPKISKNVKVIRLEKAKLTEYAPYKEVASIHRAFALEADDERGACAFVQKYGLLVPEYDENGKYFEQRVDEILENADHFRKILKQIDDIKNSESKRAKIKSFDELTARAEKITRMLEKFGSPQFKMSLVPASGSRKVIVPKLIPHTLADYLMTLCLFEACGQIIYRECAGCGRPFLINANDKNELRRVTCPKKLEDNSCRRKAVENRKNGIVPEWTG